jgi:hypothetical protein
MRAPAHVLGFLDVELAVLVLAHDSRIQNPDHVLLLQFLELLESRVGLPFVWEGGDDDLHRDV